MLSPVDLYSQWSGFFSALTGVCNSTDVNCLNDGFPSLDTLPRGSVNHVPVGTEDLLGLPSNGESDCFTLFDTGFYPPELNSVSLCSEENERPAKRIKMGISVPEPFINDVSVNNLSVDFDNHSHHITSAKMAVSMADFSSLSANDTTSFISSRTLHHTALQSEWLLLLRTFFFGNAAVVKSDHKLRVCLVFHWKFELFSLWHQWCLCM